MKTTLIEALKTLREEYFRGLDVPAAPTENAAFKFLVTLEAQWNHKKGEKYDLPLIPAESYVGRLILRQIHRLADAVREFDTHDSIINHLVEAIIAEAEVAHYG